MHQLFKETAKRTVCPLMDGLGVYDRRIRQLAKNRPVWLVLMYHRLVAERSEDPLRLGMCTTTQSFREQMDFLKERFEPLSMPEAVARLQAGRAMPPLSFSVTFDDGYADFASEALPILEAMNIPASVYVTTGGLTEDEPFWWDRLASACLRTGRSAITPEEAGLPQTLPLQLRSQTDRTHACRQLSGMLWQLPIEEALQSLQRLEAALEVDGRTGAPARLSPEQVAALSRHPLVELGAHTVRHPNMRLLSQAELAWEVRTSRMELEAISDRPVTGFAYPGGHLNAQAVWALREANMAYAVTTSLGLNQGQEIDPYRIERMGAPDSGLSDFKRCLINTGRHGQESAYQEKRMSA